MHEVEDLKHQQKESTAMIQDLVNEIEDLNHLQKESTNQRHGKYATWCLVCLVSKGLLVLAISLDKDTPHRK